MLKRFYTRALCLCLAMLVALAVDAQQQTSTSKSSSKQVTVDAPQDLLRRNNADLGKNKDNNKDNKDKSKDNKGKNSDKPAADGKKVDNRQSDKEERMNELEDDDRDVKERSDKDKEEKKDDKKKEESTIKPKPKRNLTTQQTIQSRSVGYRIQCYTDNNFRTAKAAAQQRAREIAMKFPQYRSYISYKAPSWRLRIGDFKSRREAQAALARIKSVFPKLSRQMVVVRDHINVWSND